MSVNSGQVWSKEEMIQNADNWSLAGDVALLNTMKAFSDNLLTETMNISSRIDNLINSLNDVGLRLDISRNEFQSLRNTQFIENRVYEDDETIDENENKKEEKTLTEEEKDVILKESVMRGLQVIEKYFDKVEVTVSDSEEEAGDKSLILQPKDIYADRPMPFLIGSEEWYKKWHVGLIDSSSDSESEKEPEEVYSESSSEDELPKDIYIKGSETSSEFDYSGRQSQSNGPAANSTFNDVTAQRQREVAHSPDQNEDRHSVSAKTPLSNQTFAEQLATKLGNVINQNDDIEVNKNPIKKGPTLNRNIGNLFSDEPPPLDESEDTILPKNARSGLFSGGTGLFDEDSEDDLFWGQNKNTPKVSNRDENKNAVPARVDKNENEVPPTIAREHQNTLKAQVVRGLFDSDDSSEEDIFAATKRKAAPQPYIQPFRAGPVMPLFDDEPPELEPPQKRTAEGSVHQPPTNVPPLFDDEKKVEGKEESPQKKIPIGGVSIFGDSNIFSKQDVQQKIVAKSSESAEKSEQTDRPVPAQRQNKNEAEKTAKPNKFDDTDTGASAIVKDNNKPKKISLFDDDTIFDDDDLFKNIIPQKKANVSSNLFDDLEERDETEGDKPKKGLFDVENDEPKQRKDGISKASLFDESSSDDEFDKRETKVDDKQKEIRKSSLFEEENSTTKKQIEDIKPNPRSNTLFDDNIEQSDDIFVKPKEDDIEEEVQENEEKVALKREETPSASVKIDFENKEKKSRISLFDDVSSYDETDDIFKGFRENNEINVSKKLDLFENLETKGEEMNRENVIEEKLEAKGEEKVSQEEALPDSSKHEEIKSVVEGNNPWLIGIKEDLYSFDSFSVTPKVESQPKLQVNIPSISLFDPTPPPDDDWDSKSNTSEDIDDNFSYHEELGTQRSSLFDVEPPSLRPDESSGIVRDQNFTRVEMSDDSSFYPYASSSRRLSSEIFKEEQSNDSFFVTKNKTEHQSNLRSIPEINSSSESKIEITPSGDINDFVSSDSVFEKTEEQKSTSTNNESSVPKKVSLFASDNENSDTDDSFSIRKHTENVLSKSETSSVETDWIKDGKSVESKEDLSSTEEKSRFTSISERLQNMQQQTYKKDNTAIGGSPGKLKHSLDINVGALLPGAPPPKLRDLKPRNEPCDDSEPTTATSATPENADDRPVAFDGDTVEVLHSITRDRARLPLRRRPSTRRARKEALRTSGIDFDAGKNEEETVEATGVSMVFGRNEGKEPGDEEVDNKSVVGKRTKLGEDDSGAVGNKFERVREPKRSGNELSSTAENNPIIDGEPKATDDPKQSSSLFADNDLFQAVEEEKKGGSLFLDSPDSDGGLFGKKSKQKELGKRGERKEKKSLFDDSSSDDDLFGGATGSSKDRQKHRAPVPSTVQKKPMKTVIKKLDNKETDEDPLSALFK